MKKSELKQLIKETIKELKPQRLVVGDKVMLRKDVLARHARSVPAHLGYTTHQFSWRDRLDKLEGKVGTVTKVFDNSKHVNVKFDEPWIDKDAHGREYKMDTICIDYTELEKVINESEFNINRKERKTQHDLQTTPNKQISKIAPGNPVVKSLNEMSISRDVNTSDKQNGVTGYTSHVTKCRGCGKDCNTLRKDSIGHEGVYCSKDCAENPMDESVVQQFRAGDRVEVVMTGIVQKSSISGEFLRIKTDNGQEFDVDSTNQKIKKLAF